MAKSTKSRHLIEGIVEALVEVVQVAEDDSLAHLHGDLDPVDVEADLPVFLWQKTLNMITNNQELMGTPTNRSKSLSHHCCVVCSV